MKAPVTVISLLLAGSVFAQQSQAKDHEMLNPVLPPTIPTFLDRGPSPTPGTVHPETASIEELQAIQDRMSELAVIAAQYRKELEGRQAESSPTN